MSAPRTFQKDATSKTIDVVLYDSSTFLPKTGLAYNSAGAVASYRRGATGTRTAITLATQTVGGAYSSGGFVEIDATNMPGLYRLDLPNAVIATGVDDAQVSILFTGVVCDHTTLYLTAYDPNAAGASTGDIADAVWDEATSGHTTAGTACKALTDTLADTGTDGVVLASGAITTAKFASGAIDAAALAADAGTEIAAAVWNVADAEETAVPTASAAFRDKLNFMFALVRNKVTFNKSTGAFTLKADDGSTTIASRTDTDDGTTYTKAELA